MTPRWKLGSTLGHGGEASLCELSSVTRDRGGQTSLSYKGLYWDLEKLRKVFQAPTGGLWQNWDLCWDENWGVQVLPSELLQLSHAMSSQWRCCKGSLNIALDLFPRIFTTLWRMENHLFSWTSRFKWKDIKFFLPTLSVFYLGKSYFYWSVF